MKTQKRNFKWLKSWRLSKIKKKKTKDESRAIAHTARRPHHTQGREITKRLLLLFLEALSSKSHRATIYGV